MSDQDKQFIEPSLIEEIPVFENFLNRVGFKRIDGAVFGLLVLAKRPLSSDEIEKTLDLSQSAVSLSLKTLTHFGAVECRDSREKRLKLHSAKSDSLKIVASVLRKREQEYIFEFKQMLNRVDQKSDHVESRTLRLKSINTTCDVAIAVMNFLIQLAQNYEPKQYSQIINKLPLTFDLLTQSAGWVQQAPHVAQKVKDQFGKVFKEGFHL